MLLSTDANAILLQMAIAQHGTERNLILKEKFMLEISRDPAYYAVDIHDLTKTQIR
jgi:acyl-CoA oxidase